MDDDFDYAAVDDSPDLDFLAERDAEEAYFDDEEPSEEAPPDAGAGSPLPAEERSEIAIQCARRINLRL
ncbi:hypothetical protein CDD83_906 [Cordyceps sp. RAO-2017]|nr:hypothetical protein CDD83_906 [Cordyceps sp. RAO-2017]